MVGALTGTYVHTIVRPITTLQLNVIYTSMQIYQINFAIFHILVTSGRGLICSGQFYGLRANYWPLYGHDNLISCHRNELESSQNGQSVQSRDD